MVTSRQGSAAPRAASTEETELAIAFAAHCKAAFVYPDAHQRVRETRDTFLAKIATYRLRHAGFELHTSAEHLLTATGRVQSTSPLLVWLRDRMEKMLLRSIHCTDVDADGLHAFIHRLRSNTGASTTKHVTFASLWPDEIPGLALHEFRFDGGYHDAEVDGTEEHGSVRAGVSIAARSSSGASELSDLPGELRARIRTLESDLAELVIDFGDGMAFNLEAELVRALPADIAADSESKRRFLEAVLERFDSESLKPGRGRPADPTEHLLTMFREVAGLFFAAARPLAENASPSPVGLDLVRDGAGLAAAVDPQAVLDAILACPDTSITLSKEDRDWPAEFLTVLVHRLAHCEHPTEAEQLALRARGILDGGGPEVPLVLEPLMQALLAPESDPEHCTLAHRVLAHLTSAGLFPILRRCGLLTPERMATHFPNGFLLVLNCLDQNDKEDGAFLCSLLRNIDEQMLTQAAPRLLEQNALMDRDLLDKLFSLGGKDALGIARLLLRRETPVILDAVQALLGAICGRRPETMPLHIGMGGTLPTWYLEALCELERGGKPIHGLKDQVGGWLRSHLETMPPDPEHEDQRVQTILALKAFPGAASQILLEKQLRSEGWFGLRRVSTPVRKAVEAVRHVWGNSRHV